MRECKNKERIYHLSSAVCSADEYKRIIIDDSYKGAQAAIKFFRVFLDGVTLNGKRINVFSKRPVTRRSCGKKSLPAKEEETNGIRYHYSKVYNTRLLGKIYSILSSFFWYMRKRNCSKEDVVFIDPLNVGIALGTSLACKIRKIPLVAFITDVPECYAYGTEKMTRAMKVSKKINSRADAYVLLTEQMNELVNPDRKKPYIVIEGFADSAMGAKENLLENKSEKKVCMYTGGVEAIYGLDMLVEGFLAANVPDSELHIYGAGKFSEQLQKYAQEDERIKYFGCRDNSYVVEEQIKATLLINPRYSTSEFTKYSFPSKTSEYIASGTPVLTTRLPGIPDEYFDHVFALEDESVEGMGERIREILSMPKDELHRFGADAKEWILKNKSNKAQAARLLDFVAEQF